MKIPQNWPGWRKPAQRKLRGKNGDRISANGSGAPCARITATTATPGTTSATTRRARAPTLGRRRPGRHSAMTSSCLLRAGAVERQGSDPEGAALRPDEQRRQSRRGRQGILLLPRQHADALVHEVSVQVSAGGLSLRQIWSRPIRSAVAHRHGIRADRYRRLRRGPLLRCVRRVRQGSRRKTC